MKWVERRNPIKLFVCPPTSGSLLINYVNIESFVCLGASKRAYTRSLGAELLRSLQETSNFANDPTDS